MNFKKYVLFYTLIPLTLLLVAASYYRFIVTKDYTVSYEAECDPFSSSCYIYCEDEECLEPFYYSQITRNASELFELCGDDITECEEANSCEVNNSACINNFCSEETESGCVHFDENNLPPGFIKGEVINSGT